MRTFRRGARAVVLVLVLFAGVTMAAPRADAATVSFDYVLTASDPLTDGPCAPSPTASYHYRIDMFSVDVTGDYTFVDQLNTPGVQDGYIGFYNGAFDPADPASRCIDAVDDVGTVGFTAGTTYVIVLSSFNGFDTGTFRYQVDGPGTFQMNPYAPLASSTVVSAVPNPSLDGDGVTLTATVTSAAGGTPTGTVTFLDGATQLGAAPLMNGVATLPVAFTGEGVHGLTAVYGGSAFYQGSTSAVYTQVVDTTTTTTTTTSTSSTTTASTTTSSTTGPPTCSIATDTAAASSSTEGRASTDADVAASSSTDAAAATDTSVAASSSTDAPLAASSSTDELVADDDGETGPVGMRRVAAPDPCPTTTSSSTTVPAPPATQPGSRGIGTGGRLPATGAETTSTAFAAFLMLLGGSFVLVANARYRARQDD